MEEIKQLEMLSESIKDEVEELQSLLEHSDNYLLKAKKQSFQRQLESIISNLTSVNDAVYGVFEDLNGEDIDGLQKDYDLLHEVLQEKLTHDEKLSMKFKHGIEFHY